jgi:hypothetical protein
LQCLKKSIKAIDEKEEKRRREELQEEEELAAMGVQVPMDIEEPQEEAKEEGDEASTETANGEQPQAYTAADEAMYMADWTYEWGRLSETPMCLRVGCVQRKGAVSGTRVS